MITAFMAGFIGYWLPHSHIQVDKPKIEAAEETEGSVVAPVETKSSPKISLSLIAPQPTPREPSAICKFERGNDPRQLADRDIQNIARDFSDMCKTDGIESRWCDDLQSLYYRHPEISAYVDAVAEELRRKCDEDQNIQACISSGGFAAVVGNDNLANRMFRIGCEKGMSGQSCDQLRSHLGFNNQIEPEDMFALTKQSCIYATPSSLEHRPYCTRLINSQYSDELFDELYDQRDSWGSLIFPHPDVGNEEGTVVFQDSATIDK